MRQAAKLLAPVLFALSLGCVGARAKDPPQPPVASGLGHGYALLYTILGQEKDVSQLLVIKENRERLATVIDPIAETCGKAPRTARGARRAQPAPRSFGRRLPAEELRTRELIGATRRDLLLGSSDKELELQLLLIQNEALTYAAHLADTLARSESYPERSAFLKTLWRDLTRHLHDVQALLRKA